MLLLYSLTHLSKIATILIIGSHWKYWLHILFGVYIIKVRKTIRYGAIYQPTGRLPWNLQIFRRPAPLLLRQLLLVPPRRHQRRLDRYPRRLLRPPDRYLPDDRMFTEHREPSMTNQTFATRPSMRYQSYGKTRSFSKANTRGDWAQRDCIPGIRRSSTDCGITCPTICNRWTPCTRDKTEKSFSLLVSRSRLFYARYTVIFYNLWYCAPR